MGGRGPIGGGGKSGSAQFGQSHPLGVIAATTPEEAQQENYGVNQALEYKNFSPQKNDSRHTSA